MKLPQDYTKLDHANRRAVRLEYVRLQDGKCQHCGAPLSGPPAANIAEMRVKRYMFPPTFFQWPVHLHHCHKTGMTIGAVHNHCNAVLWQYHDE